MCMATGGGGDYQPDDARVPDRVDPKQDVNDRQDRYPYARLVVEVEHCHRSVRAQTNNGFNAMNNP
jgi:hypothetical protein